MFTPTPAEFYRSIGQYCEVPYTLSDDSFNFIETNEGIFPATDESEKERVLSLIDNSIEYKKLAKNISAYSSSLYESPIEKVVQIFEHVVWGENYTFLLTFDEEYNYNVIYFCSALPDVFEGNTITFSALPIARTSFQNVGGGSTNAIVHIGCSYNVVE